MTGYLDDYVGPIVRFHEWRFGDTVVRHEFDGGSNHRLLSGGVISAWHGYSEIATIECGNLTFAATTEYYDGELPSVFQIITPE